MLATMSAFGTKPEMYRLLLSGCSRSAASGNRLFERHVQLGHIAQDDHVERRDVVVACPRH